jgi:hypothetical protein
MKLTTLVVLGAFVFGGLFVARNADNWINRLRAEKMHVVDAAKRRLHAEEARARDAVNRRIEREKARAAVALRKRIEREKARAAVALRTRVRTAKDRAAAEEQARVPKTDAPPAGMSEAAFWRLISETRTAAGNDTGRQSELLKERLTHLSPQAIIAFAQIRHGLDERAYTFDLWGAATVIEDGCSDDCFRDFRGYLISLGRGPYENALRDPDSLASVAQDAETGDWENADNVAADAYSSVTGHDFPLDDSDLSGQPRGTPFDDNDAAALARRYPQLAARFR